LFDLLPGQLAAAPAELVTAARELLLLGEQSGAGPDPRLVRDDLVGHLSSFLPATSASSSMRPGHPSARIAPIVGSLSPPRGNLTRASLLSPSSSKVTRLRGLPSFDDHAHIIRRGGSSSSTSAS